MNQYLKILIIAVAVIAVSVISYYFIVDGYPYDAESLTESYFNSVLILKGNITIGAVIAIAISSAIMLKK